MNCFLISDAFANFSDSSTSPFPLLKNYSHEAARVRHLPLPFFLQKNYLRNFACRSSLTNATRASRIWSSNCLIEASGTSAVCNLTIIGIVDGGRDMSKFLISPLFFLKFDAGLLKRGEGDLPESFGLWDRSPWISAGVEWRWTLTGGVRRTGDPGTLPLSLRNSSCTRKRSFNNWHIFCRSVANLSSSFAKNDFSFSFPVLVFSAINYRI